MEFERHLLLKVDSKGKITPYRQKETDIVGAGDKNTLNPGDITIYFLKLLSSFFLSGNEYMPENVKGKHLALDEYIDITQCSWFIIQSLSWNNSFGKDFGGTLESDCLSTFLMGKNIETNKIFTFDCFDKKTSDTFNLLRHSIINHQEGLDLYAGIVADIDFFAPVIDKMYEIDVITGFPTINSVINQLTPYIFYETNVDFPQKIYTDEMKDVVFGHEMHIRPRSFNSSIRIDEKGNPYTVYAVHSIEELIALDYILFYTLKSSKGLIGFCKQCNTPFKAARRDARFCTNKCAAAYWNNFDKNNTKTSYDVKERFLKRRSVTVLREYRDNPKLMELQGKWLTEMREEKEAILKDISEGKPVISPEEFSEKMNESFNVRAYKIDISVEKLKRPNRDVHKHGKTRH